MNENYQAMSEGVLQFLHDLGLPEYYDAFITKGYDMESDLLDITEEDLNELGITHREHRTVIKQKARSHQLSAEYNLYMWLKENGLDYYFVNFVNGELTDLADIADLELSEKIFDELEILLTSHKKRLKKAVRNLKERCPSSPVSESPVTEGWWGKPDFLQEAKYDFLCVDAFLSSTKQNVADGERLQFMVDSGSDVVTVREEILERLDLELIGPIHSKGVHASKTKNLYRASLLIGNEELEIEVMGESYDSIGSRVIRHFRHYITGGRHVWLKGDYYDPSMSPKQRISDPHIRVEASESNLQQRVKEIQQTSEKSERKIQENMHLEYNTEVLACKRKSDLMDVTSEPPPKRKKIPEIGSIVQSKLDLHSGELVQKTSFNSSLPVEMTTAPSLSSSSPSLFPMSPCPPPLISPLSTSSSSSSLPSSSFKELIDENSSDGIVV